MSLFNKTGKSDEKFNKKTAETSYKDKIRVYRTKNLYRALLVLIVIAIVAVIVRVQYINHVYSGYEVVSEVERVKTMDAKDVRLGESILTYSKDGAHCTDSKGNVLWNQTYEIQDITKDVSGGVVGIGNVNGRELYVMSEKNVLTNISTTMPIKNVTVSESGKSTVVIYDTNVTYIDTYDEKGEKIFSGQTRMSNSGYPAAVALSPNGKLLCVAYIYVDAGAVKTTVAFYNFGAVGDNYSDYLVCGFDYTDVIVPQVGFLSNGSAYAIADNRIIFYSGDEQPSLKSEILFDREIISVYENDGHIGIVFASDKDDSDYCMTVYNASADLEGKYYFSLDYTDIFFEKNGFVVYNDSSCFVRTYDDKTKYEGQFSTSITVMLPTDKPYRYIIADNKSIQVIQLK